MTKYIKDGQTKIASCATIEEILVEAGWKKEGQEKDTAPFARKADAIAYIKDVHGKDVEASLKLAELNDIIAGLEE